MLVAVTPAAAAADCRVAAGEVEICYGTGTGLDATAQSDKIGSAEAEVFERHTEATHRGAKVSAATAGHGPAGENHAAAKAVCSVGFGQLGPCTDVRSLAVVEDAAGRRAVGTAECHGATVGTTPFCSDAAARAEAVADGRRLEAAARCGSVAPLGNPCPLDLRAGAEAATVHGPVSAAAHLAPGQPAVCEEDPQTGFTCLP